MNKYAVSIAEAAHKLQQENALPFTVVLQHQSMSVEYFSPQNTDTQTPHLQDEIYVIAKGKAEFNRNGEIVFCSTGDVLFVPAGMEHRFQNFSNGFATWVIFYGPTGGEAII